MLRYCLGSSSYEASMYTTMSYVKNVVFIVCFILDLEDLGTKIFQLLYIGFYIFFDRTSF